jgi:hypothetical protein
MRGYASWRIVAVEGSVRDFLPSWMKALGFFRPFCRPRASLVEVDRLNHQ